MTIVANLPVLEIEGLRPCPVCGEEPEVRKVGTHVQISHRCRRRVLVQVAEPTAKAAAERWESGPIGLWRLA